MPSQGRAGWGEEGRWRACLALTGMVDSADPYGRQHLLSLRGTGLTGTDLSLISQQVYREIKEQGYTGSDQPIVRFFAQFRKKKHARKFKQVDPAKETPAKASAKRPPTASQVAHWITFREEQRLDWQQKYLTQLCQADLQIAQTYELIQEFITLLREREGERFDEWLSRVDEQGVTELQSFAQGLRRDYDAVKAGLTLQWSQGQVEGQVHRLKLLKRQMYGRGSFKLLRKRVLRRA
jgi:transposase